MRKVFQIIAQAGFYAGFALVIGYFSASPSYTYFDSTQAQITVSFRHASVRKEDCRRFTPQEIAQMAPNMRRPMDCQRERIPLLLELELDDRVLYKQSLSPSGIARDGAASIYQKFTVAPGRHQLVARLRDSKREQGYDYVAKTQINLRPQQHFVIDFRSESGGFLFQ